MAELMLETIARVIDMFRVENGMVLTMVELGCELGCELDCERRENRTKISDPMMKRNVRLAAAMWKYTFTWEFDFDPWESISIAKNGAFPENQGNVL